MRYFAVEADDRISDAPHPVDFHDKLDVRNLTPQKAAALPYRTLVRIRPNDYTVFPEILCSPVLLVTEEAKEVLKTYDEYLTYKQIMYMDSANGHMQLYYMPIPEFIDCLSVKRGEGSAEHQSYSQVALQRAPIRDKSIFQVKNASHLLTIIRLDLVESLLARGFRGFRLSEIAVGN